MADLESRLQGVLKDWVERSLAPLLREGSLDHDTTAEAMSRELQELARSDSSGATFAPDQFTFSVHPDAAIGLAGSFSDIHNALSRSMEQVLAEIGYKLARRLHVSLATDPTLPVGRIQVIAWHSGNPLKVTRELTPGVASEVGRPPEAAFLMLEGRRHYPLQVPEISIGRLLDNDLVLSDPHISRKHALIRLEEGRYVLYDLDSTAGTRVNGERLRSKALRPGDVITFANIEAIYGEGPGRPPTEAPPYSPPTAEDDVGAQVTPLDMKSFDFPTHTFRPPPDQDDEPES